MSVNRWVNQYNAHPGWELVGTFRNALNSRDVPNGDEQDCVDRMRMLLNNRHQPRPGGQYSNQQ